MVNVKKHLKIPFELERWIGTDDTLADEYDPPVEYTCYVEDTVTTIEDKEGKEVISMRTFYIGPEVPMQDEDLIVFDGKRHPIKKLTTLRDKKGIIVLFMAYA